MSEDSQPQTLLRQPEQARRIPLSGAFAFQGPGLDHMLFRRRRRRPAALALLPGASPLLLCTLLLALAAPTLATCPIYSADIYPRGAPKDSLPSLHELPVLVMQASPGRLAKRSAAMGSAARFLPTPITV